MSSSAKPLPSTGSLWPLFFRLSWNLLPKFTALIQLRPSDRVTRFLTRALPLVSPISFAGRFSIRIQGFCSFFAKLMCTIRLLSQVVRGHYWKQLCLIRRAELDPFREDSGHWDLWKCIRALWSHCGYYHVIPSYLEVVMLWLQSAAVMPLSRWYTVQIVDYTCGTCPLHWTQ